ncbi:MAG: copper chaperone PCu(A)C [Balneolaceae bacterium]
MKSISVLFLSSLLIFFAGCQSEEQSSSQITGEGVEVEGSWARPGSEGGTSAAYFLITNFEQEADTLLSVQSDVAQLIEVHESYEQDGDMVGMREAGQVEIPAESTIRFERGGLHVMLMQLTQSLSDGDSFELTLNFANHDNITLEIPVRR